MSRKILILGASYGSLLGTKLLLAGHDVKLACLPEEAELIKTANRQYGAYVRSQAEELVTKTKKFVVLLQGRGGRRITGPLCRCADALGADRAGRRVVR